MLEFTYKGEIIEIIEESPSVKRFKISVLNTDNFQYKPGQFIVVSFPYIAHMFPYRSYSLASASCANSIELCVVLKEDGAATPELFAMKVGEILEFTSPLGGFVLPDNTSDFNLCFVCTGTGVAPFRAMLQDLERLHWPVKQVTLIFGARTQHDLLYRSEFETLAKKQSQFTYIPVLSREIWDGEMGYVHQVYKQNKAFELNDDTLFYICGWTEMVKETKNNLKEMGYNRKQIKFESYD
jgi:CDP-4-dehydro-6-deoxyglucose reductase